MPLFYLGIQPNENIHIEARSHWLVPGLILVGYFIFILLFAGVLIFSSAYLPIGLVRFLFLIFLLFWWLSLFHALTDYVLDIWIVTDHRVIDIRHTGLFNRDLSELQLDKIQDISVKVNGLFQTMFNYGDVLIQTAGSDHEIEFKQVAKPEEIKMKIVELAARKPLGASN